MIFCSWAGIRQTICGNCLQNLAHNPKLRRAAVFVAELARSEVQEYETLCKEYLDADAWMKDR